MALSKVAYGCLDQMRICNSNLAFEVSCNNKAYVIYSLFTRRLNATMKRVPTWYQYIAGFVEETALIVFNRFSTFVTTKSVVFNKVLA